VLYPDDTTEMGRELRLKQQYFFVSASLQDMLYRFAKSGVAARQSARQGGDPAQRHPSLDRRAELMRILIDQHHLEWNARLGHRHPRTFAYTNHTLMPEALETWPVALFERVLPRHLQIIYEINHRFLKDVMHHYPGDPGAVGAHVADRRERGQAHPHGAPGHRRQPQGQWRGGDPHPLMKETIFADFHRLWPDKIVNMTNGVTPRRWLNQANPALAA
jgi:starch phosphorylase